MKNLFEPATADEIQRRLDVLRPDSPRQWGKMNAAQAVAHLALGLEIAMGDIKPPRTLLGRLIGRFVKPLALGDDRPMQRNAPTVKGQAVTDARDFEAERRRAKALLDRFATGGPPVCTTHPHGFFGRLTPDEWSVLMYKHFDHHLRQFGV